MWGRYLGVPGLSEEDDVKGWVEETLAGNTDAFDLIMKKYQRRVLRIVYQMTGNVEDARDITQDSFLKAFHYLRKYKKDKNFSSWLHRIAINTTFDFLSKRRASGESLLSGYENLEERTVSEGESRVEEKAIAKDMASKLLKKMGILTEQERAAFLLKDVEGYDTAEVALIMDLNSVTVRRHYGSARKKLKNALFPKPDKNQSVS